MKKNIIALSLLAMCLSTGAIHGSDESFKIYERFEISESYESDERSENYFFDENRDYDYDLQDMLREANERSGLDKSGLFGDEIQKINDRFAYLIYDLYPKGRKIEEKELYQKWRNEEIDKPEYFDRMSEIEEEYDKKIFRHKYIQVYKMKRAIEAYDDKEEALLSWLQKVQQKYE